MFAGYRVAITGGTRGIGRAIATAFARNGASVAICGRSGVTLADTRASLEADGNLIYAHRCDIREPGAAAAFVDAAADAMGGIDILINNASALAIGGSEDAWEQSFRVDLRAAMLSSVTAAPYLAERPGSIVNIASIAALRATVRTPAYGALKSALVHYTKTSAVEFAARGVRVNAVLPGSVEYPGGSWARRRIEDPDLYAASLRQIPLGRMGTAEAVADAVLFLASKQAAWITGAILPVDGGQSL